MAVGLAGIAVAATAGALVLATGGAAGTSGEAATSGLRQADNAKERMMNKKKMIRTRLLSIIPSIMLKVLDTN